MFKLVVTSRDVIKFVKKQTLGIKNGKSYISASEQDRKTFDLRF